MPDRDDDLPPLPEPGSSPSEPAGPSPASEPAAAAEPSSASEPAGPSPASEPVAPISPPPSSSVTWPTSPPLAPPTSPPLVGKPPALPPTRPASYATPWWARVWLLATFATGTALVLLVAAAVMVVAVGDDDGDMAASDERTTTTDGSEPSSGPTTTEVGRVTTTTAPSTTTTTAPPPPLPGFGDGLQRVGVDIQPGRYLATEVGFACYWERVSGFGGTLDDVIMNGNVQGSQAIVEVLPSDAGFTSRDCGRWVVYSPPPTPAASFDDGDWSVGQDVQPGSYRSDAGPFCWWERAVGFTHDIGDQIVDYGNPTAPVTVTISAGERFTSIGCGAWTPA